MKYKFNEANNITGYIKELLYNFNLPVYKIYNDDLTLINGRSYIKDTNVYKYSENKGSFVEIAPFEYGKRLLNATTNMKMNSSIYDTYTHEYLGDYLRFLRDYKNLNLMPLYNCFSYNSPLEFNYSISIDGDTIFNLNTSNIHYNYYIVPVKFDTEYTIAIDSVAPYEICTLIYTGNELLEESLQLVKASYTKISGSKFTTPHVYTTPSGDNNLWKQEENLKLLLKLPSKLNTSITILEGNYSMRSNVCNGLLTAKSVIPDEYLTSPSGQLELPTKLSLLSVNNGISYPFADRLVEYLLQNAITALDPIEDNIKRVQDTIYSGQVFKGIYGIWDTNIKKELYNKCSDKTIKFNQAAVYNENGEQLTGFKFKKFKDTNEDLLYYVDKDVESLLRSV